MLQWPELVERVRSVELRLFGYVAAVAQSYSDGLTLQNMYEA
jgi:hypothetical protein